MPVELLRETVGRDWLWMAARVTMLDWQGDPTANFSEAVAVRIEPPAGSDLRFFWVCAIGDCQRVETLQ